MALFTKFYYNYLIAERSVFEQIKQLLEKLYVETTIIVP